MEDLTFDLNTRRCMQVPRVWYSDRSDVWRITCVGRPLRPAVRWRVSIATSRKMGDQDIIARFNTGISVSENVLTVTVDVFFLPFRDAVRNSCAGRDLYFALYGIDATGCEAEYIEIKFVGFPTIDPPGMNPKDLLSLREYYSAKEVNLLFCMYVAASRPVIGPYDGEWLVCTVPQVADYHLELPAEEDAVRIRFNTFVEFFPACDFFWLHIDKKGSQDVVFDPDIRWYETEGEQLFSEKIFSNVPGIDFTVPGFYRLKFYWTPEQNGHPAHWSNLSGMNRIQKNEE